MNGRRAQHECRVVSVRGRAGFKAPPGSVYVGRGRGSRWGNRYHEGRDGTRDEVVALHRKWLWGEIRAGRITEADLLTLEGLDLACWCAPEACHADTLLDAVRWAVERRDGRRAA